MATTIQTHPKPQASESIPLAVINLEHLPDDALLKSRDFCALTGWSFSTLKRKWQDGTIQEPIRLSKNSLRWRAAYVRGALSRLASGSIRPASDVPSL